MGRTNWILLVMGVVACALLTWVMQQGASLQVEKRRLPAVREVQELLGRRLEAAPRLVVHHRADGVAAELTLPVMRGIRTDQLAIDAAHVVWRRGVRATPLLEVVVECRSDATATRWFRVPPPWRPSERLIELPGAPVAAPR